MNRRTSSPRQERTDTGGPHVANRRHYRSCFARPQRLRRGLRFLTAAVFVSTTLTVVTFGREFELGSVTRSSGPESVAPTSAERDTIRSRPIESPAARVEQVAQELAQVRLDLARTELRAAERRFSAVSQLARLGHASKLELRQAQRKFDTSRIWLDTAESFQRQIHKQLVESSHPTPLSSFESTRPDVNSFSGLPNDSTSNRSQWIGLVKIDPRQTPTMTPVHTRTRAAFQHSFNDTLTKQLKHRLLGLRAIKDPDLSTRNEMAGVADQLKTVQLQQRVNALASQLKRISTAHQKTSVSPTRLQSVPQPILLTTYRIAQAESSVTGQLNLAQQHLRWNRLLLQNIQQLRTDGHASVRDEQLAHQAVDSSQAQIAAIARHTKQREQFLIGLEPYLDPSVTPIRPASVSLADAVVDTSAPSVLSQAESLQAAAVENSWMRLESKAWHECLQRELDEQTWRVEVLTQLRRTDAASPSELQFAMIRRNALVAEIQWAQDTLQLVELRRQQIEAIAASLQNVPRAESVTAISQLRRWLNWSTAGLIEASGDQQASR